MKEKSTLRKVANDYLTHTKNENAITLIALVVTIVVLLILAAVSIGMLTGENGIIKQAVEAKNKNKKAEIEEEYNINKLLEVTEDEMSESWVYNQANQTVTNGKVTLKLGDYVDYDCKLGVPNQKMQYISKLEKNGYGDQTFSLTDYNYGWRVFGVDENGRLELISEECVPLTGGYDSTEYNRTYYYLGDANDDLKTQVAYINAVDELNDICKIYGYGKGAIEARCVKIEDINKILGKNPSIDDYTDERLYGNTVTYSLSLGKIYYQGTKYPMILTENWRDSFEYCKNNEWKQLAEGESVSFTCNYFEADEDDIQEVIDENSQTYKMLFINSSTGANPNPIYLDDGVMYWLASQCIRTKHGFVKFGVQTCGGWRKSWVLVDYMPFWHSGEGNGLSWEEDNYLGVRPVVSLSRGLSLYDSGSQRDGCSLWNIVF